MKTNDPAYSEYKSKLIQSIHSDIRSLVDVRNKKKLHGFSDALEQLVSAAELLEVFQRVEKEDWFDEDFVIAKRKLLGEASILLAEVSDLMNGYVNTIEHYEFVFDEYEVQLDSIVSSLHCLLENFPMPMNVRATCTNSRLAEVAKNINFDDFKNLADDPTPKRIIRSKDGRIESIAPDLSRDHKSPVRRLFQRIVDFMPNSEARRKEKEFWQKSSITKQEIKALTKTLRALDSVDNERMENFYKLAWQWGAVTATYREIESLLKDLEGIQVAMCDKSNTDVLVKKFESEYEEISSKVSTQRLIKSIDSSIKMIYDDKLQLVDELEFALHDVKFMLATMFNKQYAVYVSTNDINIFISELWSQKITYAQLYEFFLYLRIKEYLEAEIAELPKHPQMADVNLLLTPNVQIENNNAQVIDNEPGGIIVPQLPADIIKTLTENKAKQLPNK